MFEARPLQYNIRNNLNESNYLSHFITSTFPLFINFKFQFKNTDYSIYHEDITVVDPSGVQLTGIDNYKSSIKFLQQFVNFWFQTEQNDIQFRLVYDFARSSVKVSWHAVLEPKMPMGKPLHVDGISMYRLETESGKIIEHKFETMSINNTPIVPPYGVFSLMQQEWGLVGTGVPGGQIPVC